MNEILQVAMIAGQMILENGGETYRVEETIWRICKIYGAEEAESFATPTGIMASICHEGKIYSLTRRVSNRTVNLDKIDKVNDLSRSILSKKLSVTDFKKELIKINKEDIYPLPVIIIFSALGAGSFSVLFGGTLKDVFAAFLIGLIIKYITVKWSEIGINLFFVNSICSGIAALLAIILYKLGIASQVNQTIIGAIMLLVPGLAITNAIRDTISGDLLSGIIRAAEAFLVAISIAVGTGAVLSFWISNFGGI
ncbi:threonine/serine exporter family protein [Clostridium sp. D53t1_180928_C8]|uniref:threonine/serine exporter family protein n=1 Tax=Clostridium sp. D53t1_180928_C8 TaxID=2787101 RepID=UPI0018AB0E9B|nr:threonine/serine exporter family protein [Clostridium sp. D53t1_180928_C8]